MGEFIGIIFIIFVYFLPTWIANSRKHKHKETCGILNLFFAWIPFVWLFMLVWSLMSKAE